ncbi:MAG: hypothetical protein ABR529_03500 [Actinomycetota bacterium]
MSDDLPSRRKGIRGTDLDGNDVELSFGISKKLYRCPGCREYLPVGSEHVIARFREPSGAEYHQHWHSDCARRTLVRELRSTVTTFTDQVRRPGGQRRRRP